MRFVDPGVGTVNEGYLLETLGEHGRLIASGREICYRREFRPTDDRFIGDAFGLFEKDGLRSLVGIEIKDWAAPVTPKIARDYLETYGRSCDFVYLAARRFLPGVASVRNLGLINLDGPKLKKAASRLAPERAGWDFVVRQMAPDLALSPLHPRQRRLMDR